MKEQRIMVKAMLVEPRWKLLKGLAGLERRTQASILEDALAQYAAATGQTDPTVKILLEQTQ